MVKQIDFKVNNFDLLRLLAATQVIVDHYYQHLNIPITNSLAIKLLNLFPGVPVFFIISGYLISASYERNSNLKDYFRNRGLRIFPALWCCILLTVVVFSITGVNFLNKATIAWLPSQFAGLIYTPHFLSNYGFGSYNGSIWTIPLELQFYVLLPICYNLVSKDKLNYLLLVLFIVFMGCNFWYYWSDYSPMIKKFLRYSFIPLFYLFLIGAIFQRLKMYNTVLIFNKALYWLAGYIAFSFLFFDYITPVIYSFICSVLLSFCLLSMAYTLPNTAKKLLRSNDISYGIYIYHGLILTVIVQLKLQSHINLFIVIVMAYIMGYLSWISIERPFIRLKRKTIRATI